MSVRQTIHRRYAHPGEGDPYRLLPFEVPAGASRLAVRYRYGSSTDAESDGQAPGCVVDLGLFDPRGHTFLDAEGFRGWSGGARTEVTIGAAAATPGYLPGPVYAGTWHVLLGLYRIPPDGCEVLVEVEVTSGGIEDGVAPVYQPAGALCEETRWYRGDLHCHSHHSDAAAGVHVLVAAARAQGLDYLAVTDHNTPSHLPDLAAYATPDLLLIPGIEVTTNRGHANVWGVRGWHEFRTISDAGMARIRAHAQARGLLFSINHPKTGGPPWAYGGALAPDAVEAWQAPWFLNNYESLAFWDRLLRAGARPTLVGGSDKHQGPFTGTPSGYEVGTPTTWVYATALSEEAILAGIRHGHVYVSRKPGGPRLSFEAQVGGERAMVGDTIHVHNGEEIVLRCRVQGAPENTLLRAVGREGETWRTRIEGDDWTAVWTMRAVGPAPDWQGEHTDYVRLEVIEPPSAPLADDPGALMAHALSNPIYVSIEL